MVCPKCGCISPDTQKYCTGCGTELTVYYQQQQRFLQKQQQQQMMQSPQQQYDRPATPLYGQNQAYNYAQVPDNAIPNQKNHKVMGTFSLILGIFSLVNGIIGIVLGCWPLIGLIISIFGLICGIVSIPLGKVAKRKIGVAIAGVVCSLVPIILNVILLVSASSLQNIVQNML